MNGVPAYDTLLALYREGALEQAEAGAAALQAAAPDHAGALQLLGVIAARSGRLDAALAWLDRAAAIDPRQATLHNHRGNVLLALDREEQAVAAYDQAVALGLEDAQALNNRGAALQALHRFDAALASFERALALRPDFADALLNRGELLLEIGQRSAGIAALQRAREAGADAAKIGFTLASLGVEPAAAAAPPEFVRELFDQYAEGFDAHLTGRLGYRAPTLVAQAVEQLARPPASLVDLGCGTGLCGPLLRPLAARLEGVDLSANMLERARERGCYDELHQAEIGAHLRARGQAFDIAVAADVLIYFGALDELFAAVHAALRPGGCFVFTVEAGEGADPVLQPTRRYAHSRAYLERLAAAQGFGVQRLDAEVLRHEGRVPLQGLLAVLQKVQVR